MVGGKAFEMTIVNGHVAVLPALSVAVQPPYVVPIGNTEPEV
jgi:hypothetical protein